jgi:putative redox protein
MKTKINCTWDDGMSFQSAINGINMTIDAAPEVGGENKGPRPKPLMLLALAGCTGMDVISILKKMRVQPEYFNIVVESEMTDEHPKVYTHFHIIYEYRGKDLPMEKLEKAVELSQERYCGVSAMYRNIGEITHEIRILE